MRYKTFAEIINLWGVANLSRKLKFRMTTIQKWKERNHIPSQYWKELIAMAKVDGLSLASDDFIEVAARCVPDKSAKKRK